jgi:hypothetical protein
MKTNMHQTPEASEGIYPKAEMKQKKVSRMLRTQIRVSISLAICAIFLLSNSCKKEISEPKHKNDGSNVLYFNIDGKGYMLRDQCWDVPTRKTGEIFTRDDKDRLPALYQYTGANLESFSLITSFCFDKPKEEYGECGYFQIFFTKTNNQYVFQDFQSTLIFYSPKLNRRINISGVTFVNTPSLNIEKLDTEEKVISGSIEFDFKEFNKDTMSNCHIYFDLKIDYINNK